MQRKTLALLLASHLLVGAAGFAAGIYALPILIAPPAPPTSRLPPGRLRPVFTAPFAGIYKTATGCTGAKGRSASDPIPSA